MSVKTPRFSGPFKWSALRQQLLSLRDDVHTIRKVAGRNVTIDEHRGKGKVINVERAAAGGACCLNGDCTITTASNCGVIGGTYQGDDTTCEGVDCGNATSGACCVDTDCSIQTPSDCAGMGGSYQGDGTTCDPNPCGGGGGGGACPPTTGDVTCDVEGLTPCPCIDTGDGFSKNYVVNLGEMPLTLVWDGSTHWSTVVTDAVTVRWYNDDHCGDYAPEFDEHYDAFIRLLCTPGETTYQLDLKISDTFESLFTIFRDIETFSDPPSVVMTNTLDCAPVTEITSGGTATLDWTP